VHSAHAPANLLDLAAAPEVVAFVEEVVAEA
jgi:hypothetical protein